MKKILSLILAFAIVIGMCGNFSFLNFKGFSIKASAAYDGPLTFNLNYEGTAYEVSACNSAFKGDLIIPETYNGKNVESISDCAFYDCIGITSITIPKTITKIPGETFLYSPSLKNINVDPLNKKFMSENGVLFYGNKYILLSYPSGKTDKSYAVPDGVAEIYRSAFENNKSIESVTFPKSLTTIRNRAFNGCSSIKSITIPDGVSTYTPFQNCSGLETLVIGSDADFYEDSLSGCSSLKNIEVSKDNVFITVENGVIYNKDKTELLFYSPKKPETTYTVADTVKKIGDRAFENATFLKTINLPHGITSIGSGAFYNTGFYNDNNNYVDGVLYCGEYLIDAIGSPNSTELTVKEGTVLIATQALNGNYTKITLPNTIKYINDEAACWNTNIQYVNFPEGLEEIGSSAFSTCSNLDNITLPNSLKKIGADAFTYTKANLSPDNCINGLFYIGKYLLSAIDENRNKISGDVSVKAGTEFIADGVFANANNMTSILLNPEIKHIGKGAFERCTGLKNIVIPEAVTYIGDNAFNGCGKLVFNIPNNTQYIGDFAFERCVGPNVITFPESLKYIGDSSFASCNGITEVTLPKNIEYSGNNAFWQCENLKKINIQNLASWCSTGGLDENVSYSSPRVSLCYNNEVIRNLVVPEGVTKIAESAFYNNENLETVQLPQSLKEIGDSAFEGCEQLNSITGGNNIEKIDNRAFYFCQGLNDYILPNTLKYIGDEAFRATYISRFNIGDKVSHIGECAFSHNFSLEEIAVDVKNPYFTAENGVVFTKDKSGLVYYSAINEAPEYTTPSSVRRIWGGAFAYSRFLKEITINEGVIEIPEEAFLYCKKLTKVILPKTIFRIETDAFAMIPNLKEIIIPDSLNYVLYSAFPENGIKYVLYGGTEASWNRIESYHVLLQNSIIHYNGKGHILSNEAVTIKNPTCDKPGIQGRKCTVPGCDYVEESPIKPLGGKHNFVDGVCTICQDYQYQSQHPYLPYNQETVKINIPGALRIEIVFSENSALDKYNDDSVFVSVGENQIARLFNKDIAGKRLVIQGDTVEITLVSDYDDEGYGYELSKVKGYFEPCKHPNKIKINEVAPTCNKEGYSGDIACGECMEIFERGNILPPDTSLHKFEDGECTACGAYQESYFDNMILDSWVNLNTADKKSFTRKFTPQETGYYHVKSRGDNDTKILIYKLNSDFVKNFDDFNNDLNFDGSVLLEKGETYIFRTSAYGGGVVNYDFLLEKEIILNDSFRESLSTNSLITESTNINDIKAIVKYTNTASSVKIEPSAVIGGTKYYGTGSLVSITYTNGETTIKELVVKGDVNGDSVSDVLDVVSVDRIQNHGVNYKTSQAIASSYYDNTGFDAESYQYVVNKALGK